MRTAFLSLATSVAAVTAAGLAGAGPATPALASNETDRATAHTESEPGVWTGTVGLGGSAAVTTPDGVEITISVSGDHLAIHETRGLDATPIGDASPDMFTPPVPVDGGWLGLSVPDDDCAEGATCDRGTLAVTFSEPVLDPIIHISGLGSQLDADPAGTAELALVGSTPAEAALAPPLPGATNLEVADDVIRATDPETRPALCADGAGCGTVPVSGAVTGLTFDVALRNVLSNTIGDGLSLQVWAAPVPPEPSVEPAGDLPVTGVPAAALGGLGAAGLLLGFILIRVRARAGWRGTRRA